MKRANKLIDREDNQPLKVLPAAVTDLEKHLGKSVGEALDELFQRIKAKPKEYEIALKSLEPYLDKKGHIKPREYKYFINWCAFGKYANLGMGKLFAKEILDSDFIEYSEFRRKIAEGEVEKPFWYADLASDWLDGEKSKKSNKLGLSAIFKNQNTIRNAWKY